MKTKAKLWPEFGYKIIRLHRAERLIELLQTNEETIIARSQSHHIIRKTEFNQTDFNFPNKCSQAQPTHAHLYGIYTFITQRVCVMHQHH